jgi:hypothetical protein
MKKIVLIVICLFLISCNHNENSTSEQEIKQQNSIEKTMILEDEFIMSSNIGLDFNYPSPSLKYWNMNGPDNNDCTCFTNKKNSSRIYVLKNIDSQLSSNKNFKYNLNGKDIPQYLDQQLKKYAGFEYKDIEIDKEYTKYETNIKFYNCFGAVKDKGIVSYVSMAFFQSQFYIPEVYGIEAPCVILILYEDENLKDEVNEMLKKLKNGIYYPK